MKLLRNVKNHSVSPSCQIFSLVQFLHECVCLGMYIFFPLQFILASDEVPSVIKDTLKHQPASSDGVKIPKQISHFNNDFYNIAKQY